MDAIQQVAKEKLEIIKDKIDTYNTPTVKYFLKLYANGKTVDELDPMTDFVIINKIFGTPRLKERIDNILNELSKRPPLDIDSAVNAKILKTDADITTYNKNVENKLVAILISMGMTDGTARKTLGI